MVAVARRLEQQVKFPRGSGARSFAANDYEPRGYRLSPVRIMELKEYFGGGIGEESNFGGDIAARLGVAFSYLSPSSEDSDLIGAEKYLYGSAHDAFLKLERARQTVARVGLLVARVLSAAYGPARVHQEVHAKYNVRHRLDALPNLVLITPVLNNHRVAMIRELVEQRIKRADEAAQRSHELVSGTPGDMTGSGVSNPAHIAQRDIAHGKIRRGTTMEVTPQIALADALYLGPKPPKEVETLRRSFVVESTREADTLLADASREYSLAWKG